MVRDGHVAQLGDADALLRQLPDQIEVVDYSGRLILPGFIDTHTHYCQIDVIASYGEQLLDWLEEYTFPIERQFENETHARDAAEFFIEELLRNGTTTALVLGTVHKQSVTAIFEAAQSKRMRLLAGKVMMDRNCPEYLQDTATSSYSDSKELIEAWHHRERLHYAVTPRFAPTSTEEQLKQVGRLIREHPDVYLQTHVAESKDEVEWVAKLFPWSRSYLDVYDRYGLLRERSVLAHCIHLDDRDRQRMADAGAAMSFCPTANLFLGSGLFDMETAIEKGIRVGVGTDVGGGTSFSLLQTLNEAYKVTQMRGQRLSPYRALYLATLGGAEALYLHDKIGNFAIGKEADFIVVDLDATPLLERRMRTTTDLSEKLFALIMLGDDRAVVATYIVGQRAHARTNT